MSVIRILDEDVSNRIAAGEVVERPASIVKELVENSLDAEATRITIQIERGGRSLVRIIDDGRGMDAEDALLCLEAHATSKVRSTEDIENIQTMGFRGEAMPSIASVTRFTIRTRQKDSAEGTEVEVSGGTIRDVKSVGCAPGTSITARNLFFNMPARRKFLRTIPTEEGHIQEMVLLLALANPGIGFELSFDQRPVLTVQPGQDLKTRAAMVLGRDLTAAMIDVDYEEEGVRVYGLAARPGFTRSSRRDQRIFVNARPVTDQTVYFAIRDAYHTLVMKGRYPPVLLFIELPSDLVDINVHPSKREVRFRDGRGVSRITATAIRSALQDLAKESIRPADRVPGEVPIPRPAMAPFLPNVAIGDAPRQPTEPTKPASEELIPETPSFPTFGPPTHEPKLVPPDSIPEPDHTPISETEVPQQPLVETAKTIAPGTTVSAAQEDEIAALRVIGSLGDSYLLAEGNEGMVLIDQHAAHERILFERLLANARNKDGSSQGLLIPVTMDVSPSDAQLLGNHKEDLEKLGFEISNFGGNTFMINAVPPHFPQDNIVGILIDIIDELRSAPLRAQRADEHQITTAACKAAVKAHDKLKDQEVTKLLEQLRECELPYTCPHGRPTMIKISYLELEKRFGRRAP